MKVPGCTCPVAWWLPRTLGALTLGAAIYLLWRPPTLWLFVVVQHAGAMPVLEVLRHGVRDVQLPALVLLTLPASCWAFAFNLTMASIWADAGRPARAASALVTLALVGAAEVAQALPGVPGAFDVADLSGDAVAGLVATFTVWRRC